MKRLLFSLLLITSIQFESIGQFHDFDSLVDNNEHFKTIAKTIGDTLDLFNDNNPMEFIIESDFKKLIKRKFKDEYQGAYFKTMFNDTVLVTRNIKIKPRGNMRKSTCHFPPLKLNFPKKDAYLTQIQEFDKLKMVLDCKRGNIYEQYLLSEFYIYKMFNLLSEYSLRVRLLRVTYVDTSGKYKNATRYAFLIESIDQLAKRLNHIRIKPPGIRDQNTNHQVLSMIYLFQYLIGNTDWSIAGSHNVYYLKSKNPTESIPLVVPYDFDYAGLVDANYAVPHESIGTESVRERVYWGYCIPDNLLQEARDHMIKNKDKIYNIYQNDQLLDKNNKRNTISYLDDFFKIIKSDNSFRRTILESCRE